MRPRSSRFLARVVAASALLALLVYATLLEPRWVVVTHHVIGRARAGEHPIRIAQLSDLHLREIGAREGRAARLARSERADLIVLTGDMVEDARGLPALDAFLSLLGDEAPVLAVLGNWEDWTNVPHGALREVLARHHGSLLVNEAVTGVHEGRRWAVIGLDVRPGGLTGIDPRALEPGVSRLVLAHEPVARDRWRGPPAAAMLSGHTHGGQVALGRLAPIRPEGSGAYVSGWYRGPPLDLHVSRGVGTSGLPLRLGARPEVAVFEWWPE